jgi:anthranilate/para-aminobenzoate synthase component I
MHRCPFPNPTHPERRHRGLASFAGLGIGSRQKALSVLGTWVVDRDALDPIRAIEEIIAGAHPIESNHDSGWVIMLSYELGRRIEPKAHHQTPHLDTTTSFPLAVVQRWVGDELEQGNESTDYQLGPVRSSMGRKGYIDAVERTLAYIRAGDIYQANIAHHLDAPFSGSVTACFTDLTEGADPRFGAMMCFDHEGTRHAICSISPELFLEYDPQTRLIRTEPMKGTRPIGADVSELRESIKDRAELDMITDLMRNDLGRVAALGSVRVTNHRHIDSHRSGVLQASSSVEGRLAAGNGFGEILRATFPPGSVTGVPKVRAMQIIDELEVQPRNAYCGSMLVLDDHGAIKASVSIRTAHIWGDIDPDQPDVIHNGHFNYAVGAGVVADSDPEAEWAETLTKASVLGSALGIKLDTVSDHDGESCEKLESD